MELIGAELHGLTNMLGVVTYGNRLVSWRQCWEISIFGSYLGNFD